MIEFTGKDLTQLKQKGVSKEKVLQQIETFKEGIPFVNLKKAAVIDVGIVNIDEGARKELVSFFEDNIEDLKLLKFVPASGAASRMFKAMFNFVETYNPNQESLSDYIKRTGDDAVKEFVDGMDRFPFYEKLQERLGENFNSEGEKAHTFVKEMLAENGLNYGFYPKGLLPFHVYGNDAVTPFEEHLKEAALYAKTNGKANLHFTISEQHDKMFKAEEDKAVPKIAERTTTKFNISYSNQKPSTDTLAVNMDNAPFRNSDDSILFRPGGHGALIENLNERDADIIFIKNIDNVVSEKNLDEVANSKKMLAGLLLKVQKKAFKYAKKLESKEIHPRVLRDTAHFLEKELNVRFPSKYDALSPEDQLAILRDKINRPIRICGMVKNEGEPGGGPFWISDKNGNISLQIVESAQIDMDNKEQVDILKKSTHFNPVDIICGVKDHTGKKFNLLNFVDSKQGFITDKTKDGKELKALELPGLWNGAMAFWNTIFVEVPLVTFNPVKTVNDLLKASHQA